MCGCVYERSRIVLECSLVEFLLRIASKQIRIIDGRMHGKIVVMDTFLPLCAHMTAHFHLLTLASSQLNVTHVIIIKPSVNQRHCLTSKMSGKFA